MDEEEVFMPDEGNSEEVYILDDDDLEMLEELERYLEENPE